MPGDEDRDEARASATSLSFPVPHNLPSSLLIDMVTSISLDNSSDRKRATEALLQLGWRSRPFPGPRGTFLTPAICGLSQISGLLRLPGTLDDFADSLRVVGEWGGEEAVGEICNLLSVEETDENKHLRECALRALGTIGGVAATERLALVAGTAKAVLRGQGSARTAIAELDGLAVKGQGGNTWGEGPAPGSEAAEAVVKQDPEIVRRLPPDASRVVNALAGAMSARSRFLHSKDLSERCLLDDLSDAWAATLRVFEPEIMDAAADSWPPERLVALEAELRQLRLGVNEQWFREDIDRAFHARPRAVRDRMAKSAAQ